MNNLWKGIAIVGIWVGAAYMIANGNDITTIGPTIATVFVAMC